MRGSRSGSGSAARGRRPRAGPRRLRGRTRTRRSCAARRRRPCQERSGNVLPVGWPSARMASRSSIRATTTSPTPVRGLRSHPSRPPLRPVPRPRPVGEGGNLRPEDTLLTLAAHQLTGQALARAGYLFYGDRHWSKRSRWLPLVLRSGRRPRASCGGPRQGASPGRLSRAVATGRRPEPSITGRRPR